MLKNSVLKAGNWPISKSELVNRNLKQLIDCINSMALLYKSYGLGFDFRGCHWNFSLT
jgi:hypothetical protein